MQKSCFTLAVAMITGVAGAQATDAAPKAPASQPAPKQPAPKAPAAATPFKSVTPEKHEGTDDRIKMGNEISRKGEAQLVFLGDSITQGWEGGGKDVWATRYEPRKAANFGISGDRTEHVIWRLDHGLFDGLKPKLIVVMIGTNNTGHRQDPAAETAAGVRGILMRVRDKCPEAKILLLGIFPRGETPADPMRKLNSEANAIIKTFADDKSVFFKDIGDKFVDEKGVLKKEIMPDLLHLSPKGYEIWADAIEGDVAKLMGEKK